MPGLEGGVERQVGVKTPDQGAAEALKYLEKEVRMEVFGGEDESLMANADFGKLKVYHEKMAELSNLINSKKDGIESLHYRTEDWARKFIAGEAD